MNMIESMRAFKQVVESGGFAAAARELGQTRSTINKQVVKLEDRLGVQLLIRSTRSVRPTEAGAAFHERCLGILSDLDESISAIRELNVSPQGRLRVNAPMSFGTMYLTSVVAQFMRNYPDVQVELALTDRLVDPIEEGFDVTIRISEPRVLTSLISKEISRSRRVICASPGYIETFGAPEHPRDIRQHRCLHYGYHEAGGHWQLTGPDGEHSVPINCAMWANNGEALRDAAVQDQGITIIPEFIAGSELQAGRLVEILSPYQPHEVVIYATYPRHRHLSSKVRMFVQFINEHVGEPAAWQA